MPNLPNADDIIAALHLAPLPHEGGFFRQTWKSAHGSAIYFLLTPEGFSALHRMRTLTELWHFHAGDPVEHLTLDPATGETGRTILGIDLARGQIPQLVVPAGQWQGARTVSTLRPWQPAHHWSLVSCTVTPPWDDADFELGSRDALTAAFPAQAPLIRSLTR